MYQESPRTEEDRRVLGLLREETLFSRTANVISSRHLLNIFLTKKKIFLARENIATHLPLSLVTRTGAQIRAENNKNLY